MNRTMKKSKKKSKNKNKANFAKATQLSTEQLIKQAETAMDVSDCALAIKLYGMASESIRSDIEKKSGEIMERRKDIFLLAKVLGRSGEARVSQGDVESGRECFMDAISILDNEYNENIDMHPESLFNTENENLYEIRAGLHLYIGQLSMGEEALVEYKKGVFDLETCVKKIEDLLKVKAENGDSLEIALMDIRKQICSAHCSIAELYLTDLCYDPDAESQCEAALSSALKYDSMVLASYESILQQEQLQQSLADSKKTIPSNYRHPDALQALANLRLSQSRVKEASKNMIEAYDRMKKGCTAMSKLVGLGEEVTITDEHFQEELETAQELEDVDEATSLPSYEFRCQSAKLLLECGTILQQSANENESNDEDLTESNRCCEAAIQVLGSLLAENDEVIEIWYLLGCAFNSLENRETAKQYWERALEMLVKVKEGLQNEDLDDNMDDEDDDVEEQLEQIEAQMEDIQEKIQELGSCLEMDEN